MSLNENDDYDYNVLLVSGVISLLDMNPELYTPIDNMLDPRDADTHVSK